MDDGREHPEVLRGGEDQLFLVGGRHRTVELFTGLADPTDGSVDAFVANQRSRRALFRRLGVPEAGIVFPDKLVALGHLTPWTTRSLFADCYLPAIRAARVPAPFYPVRALGEPRMYLRGDTHLSFLGDRHVLHLLVDRLLPGHWPAFATHLDAHAVDMPGAGDLATKLDPDAREPVRTYRSPHRLRAEHNGVAGMNDGAMSLIENDAAITAQTLLIFGDSYLRALLSRLAHLYPRIVFCRTRYFHRELIDAVAPDAILTGCAERYLSSHLLDADRPHFLSLPLLKGKLQKPTRGFAEAYARLCRGGRIF